MENKIIKTLRTHYFAMLAVVCAMIAFLELLFEEKLTFALPDAMYIIQVFVIMFTLIFISVAIIGFTKSLEKAKGLSKEDAMVLFQREGMQRTNLLFCVLAVNAMTYCMIGYELENTLSEHGTVSRGVCKVGADGTLDFIEENVEVIDE